MNTIRCRCGKVICQVANMPAPPHIAELHDAIDGPAAVILCRHCKRFMVLRFPSLEGIASASSVTEAQDRQLALTQR